MPNEIQICTVTQLLEKVFPPEDSIIGNGLIDKGGAVIVSGPQKVGKSLFATQLALCLASQRSFLGFNVGPVPYRTLILQAEVGEKRMQERLLKQSQGFRPEDLERVMSASVFASVQLDADDGVRQIKTALETYRPDLLIIDPLANFHSGDENVARDMVSIIKPLNRFREAGVAVVLVHHHGKSSAERSNVGHKLRGSSVLPGWYDSHLSLSWANAEDRTVKLEFDLRHDEVPETRTIKLNPSTLLFEDVNDEASQLSLVVSTVEELGRANRDQVAKVHHKSLPWAGEWLRKAVEAGRLFSFQQGKTVWYVAVSGFVDPVQAAWRPSTSLGDGWFEPPR